MEKKKSNRRKERGGKGQHSKEESGKVEASPQRRRMTKQHKTRGRSDDPSTYRRQFSENRITKKYRQSWIFIFERERPIQIAIFELLDERIGFARVWLKFSVDFNNELRSFFLCSWVAVYGDCRIQHGCPLYWRLGGAWTLKARSDYKGKRSAKDNDVASDYLNSVWRENHSNTIQRIKIMQITKRNSTILTEDDQLSMTSLTSNEMKSSWMIFSFMMYQTRHTFRREYRSTYQIKIPGDCPQCTT